MDRKKLKMDVLEKYFSINGNVATLKLVYDTFAELINPNFGDDTIEKLNDKLFSDILEAVALLPKKFKLNIKIEIRDFGNYTKSECEKIIKQNIHLLVYRTIKENQKKCISGWSLIGIGAVILLLSYLLRDYDLWFDLINISATLFVWEGVNTAFIERNYQTKKAVALARAVQDISINEFKKPAPKSKAKPASKSKAK